jgi:hypothetical protein
VTDIKRRGKPRLFCFIPGLIIAPHSGKILNMINKSYKYDIKTFLIPLTGFIPVILFSLYGDFRKPGLFGKNYYIFIFVFIAFLLAWGFLVAGRKVSVDDENITFYDVFGEKTASSWKDVRKLSENIVMRCIELFDAAGKRILFVDYQMENYVELAGIILDKSNVDINGLKAPLTFGTPYRVIGKMFSMIIINDMDVTVRNIDETVNLLYTDIKNLRYDYDYSNGGLSARIYITTREGREIKLVRQERLPLIYLILRAGISGKICRGCQIVNRIESAFCSNCGKEIQKWEV